AGRPGAYLKVLRTGAIGAGDPVEVLSRPDHEVTVGHMFGAQDPAKMQRMLDSGVDLMDELRDIAQRVAASALATATSSPTLRPLLFGGWAHQMLGSPPVFRVGNPQAHGLTHQMAVR